MVREAGNEGGGGLNVLVGVVVFTNIGLVSGWIYSLYFGGIGVRGAAQYFLQFSVDKIKKISGTSTIGIRLTDLDKRAQEDVYGSAVGPECVLRRKVCP